LAKRKESRETFEGARKVAALLSMVDPKTADALLAQFEPEVVDEIVREAKNIKDAPPEEFEAVLSEFLRSTEETNFENLQTTPTKGANVLTPEIVARFLRNERSFVGAVVLANMSPRERLRTLELLPQEQAEGIRRMTSVYQEPSPVSKELEQAFIRRVLQNER